MKRPLIILLLNLAVVSGCNNYSQKIVIDPTFSFSIHNETELIVKDSTYPKTWEASFQDDCFTVYQYSINQVDTLTNDTLRQHFKKNVNAFLKPFDLRHLDSTYTFQQEYSQSDLTFDYMSNGVEYKFFGKLVASRQSFIAFCFHTPLPIDNYSKRLKDNILNSIEIR